MARQYRNEEKHVAGSPASSLGQSMPVKATSLKERVGALRNLRPFMTMVWRTSPHLTAASLFLRLVRAVLPVAALYIGKLIIDDIILLMQTPAKPETLQQWLASGLLKPLVILLAVEFGLAVLTDVLGRIVSLVDSLLGERVSNDSSIRLMENTTASALNGSPSWNVIPLWSVKRHEFRLFASNVSARRGTGCPLTSRTSRVSKMLSVNTRELRSFTS